jgi:hypothetical protein
VEAKRNIFMHNLSLLEECYKKFAKNLHSLIPEGIYFVNLELLYHFDLLHFQPCHGHQNSVLPRYFQLIESPEKIILLNDEFVIWIIPEQVDHIHLTYVLIALNQGELEPQLEIAFIASGVYNSSNLILKVLDKFLIEIHETETDLFNMENFEDT